MLGPELAQDGIKQGRDKFFGVLRERELLLERLPSFTPKTHELPAQSARGCQYCCHAYVDELTKHFSGISMTEEAHGYENALAEGDKSLCMRHLQASLLPVFRLAVFG
jgi:hypothetical protein